MMSKQTVAGRVFSSLAALLLVFGSGATTRSTAAGPSTSSAQPKRASALHAQPPEIPDAAMVDYWFHVFGEAFAPVSTLYGRSGFGDGCVWTTGDFADDALLSYALTLPAGAAIQSIRIEFYDVAVEDGTLELVEFTASYGGVTLKAVHTAGADGWGTVTDVNVDQSVDYYVHSYGLHWTPDKGGHDMMLCGVRLRYSLPVTFNLALPSIAR